MVKPFFLKFVKLTNFHFEYSILRISQFVNVTGNFLGFSFGYFQMLKAEEQQ